MKKKKVVALIPIKLQSQRVKNKNLRPLGNHELCWYVPNTLLESNLIDEVYIFCSDEKVMKYVPKGCIFLKRDTSLDSNETKGFQIYESFIKQIVADVYILAHTTSPFLKLESLNDAIARVLSGEYDSSFSAKKIQTFAWYQGKPINYDIANVPRTQDMEPILVETSAFFIFNNYIFTEHGRRIGFQPYIKEVDDIEAIDIDEEQDLVYAQTIKNLEDKNNE